MSTLTCPKCHGDMRGYERSGVHVDQCADCRGIFLDRGELERLIDAENSWAERSAPPSPAQPGYAMPPSYDQRHDRGYDDHRGKPHKRRKSFLEELFD